jgi:hypothetical protein
LALTAFLSNQITEAVILKMAVALELQAVPGGFCSLRIFGKLAEQVESGLKTSSISPRILLCSLPIKELAPLSEIKQPSY